MVLAGPCSGAAEPLHSIEALASKLRSCGIDACRRAGLTG